MRIRRTGWIAIAAAAVSTLVWLLPGLGHDNPTVARSNAQPVVGLLAPLLEHRNPAAIESPDR